MLMMMMMMTTIYFYFIFVSVFVHVHVVFTENNEDVSLDSVIIDAADIKDTQNAKRSTKQILFQNNYGLPSMYSLIPQIPQITIVPSQQQPSVASPLSILATTGPCYNDKGELVGKCIPFKECYPYFKLPDVSNFDTWILSMYNTCSYYTSQGKQIFGVCCSNEILNSTTTSSTPSLSIENSNNKSEEQSSSPNVISNANQNSKIPNWPPPIPTHPPDHTIPPLPTHPPNAIYPGTSTTISTIKPSRKPSVKPSRPTLTTSTTTLRTTTKGHDVGAPIPSASCGAKNGFQDQGKIVGGHNADPNEWPWIAALFINGRQFCGGSLIDTVHILTAAHCVAHMTSWDVAKLTVKLGDHDIKSNYEVRHLEKRVKRVVRHRGFDSRTLYNDIALLTLDSPVQFTSVIRPLCLPSSVGARDWAGSTATVIGWGSIRESGPQPAVLQEVDIPIWSNRDCKLKYGHAAPGGIVDHMLCAGQANRDSCSGDSGGPLMVNHGKWTQVGVVSWGIGCGKGQYPGVYTRVQSFLPWIMKNLKQ